MKNFWERLTKRQQYTLMGGGIAVAILILAQAFFFPLYDAHARARRALAANQRILKDMIPLGSEYRKWRQNVAQVEGAIASRGRDFNLFSYVEKRTGDAAIKQHVKYINPAKTATTGPYE
jgi:type II secretory pathway component PulM